MPASIYARVRELAERDRRSFVGELVYLLDQAMELRERGPGIVVVTKRINLKRIAKELRKRGIA